MKLACSFYTVRAFSVSAGGGGTVLIDLSQKVFNPRFDSKIEMYELLRNSFSLNNGLWKVEVACSGALEEFLEWIFAARDGVWQNMWLMIRTSAKEGSAPRKVGCGIIKRVTLGGLLGINWTVSPVAAVTLHGALWCVHVITHEVLNSKCVTEKSHKQPKDILACMSPIVSR